MAMTDEVDDELEQSVLLVHLLVLDENHVAMPYDCLNDQQDEMVLQLALPAVLLHDDEVELEEYEADVDELEQCLLLNESKNAMLEVVDEQHTLEEGVHEVIEDEMDVVVGTDEMQRHTEVDEEVVCDEVAISEGIDVKEW